MTLYPDAQEIAEQLSAIRQRLEDLATRASLQGHDEAWDGFQVAQELVEAAEMNVTWAAAQ